MKSLFENGRCTRKIDSSYYGVRVEATFNELFQIIGKPHSTSNDKINNVWFYENENGDGCTIYDFKSNGNPSSKPDRIYYWHIGSFNLLACDKFKEEIEIVLDGYRKMAQ